MLNLCSNPTSFSDLFTALIISPILTLLDGIDLQGFQPQLCPEFTEGKRHKVSRAVKDIGMHFWIDRGENRMGFHLEGLSLVAKALGRGTGLQIREHGARPGLALTGRMPSFLLGFSALPLL